jgi:hypothetical protein
VGSVGDSEIFPVESRLRAGTLAGADAVADRSRQLGISVSPETPR